MLRKKIDVSFDHIDTVYHMADIHIRNLKRHKEYNEVFEELYKEIKQDTKNAIIYVGGDIAHAKTDLSPELVDMISKFFSRLADIAPTIVITGNHDCNLNNPDRLDALNPIIENLNHPNLHYLRDSGIYTIADTDFVVYSVFDEPGNFITADECHSPNKVVLYHGVVDGSIMDSGMQLKNDRVTLAHFNNFDIGALGDIHKFQWLNDKKTIAYSSSLIQQNHGEDYKNHGIIKWDIPTRKGKFIPIKNNYGFYTLYVRNDEIAELGELPAYPRLRVNVENSLMTNVKKIIADVKMKYNVRDVVINTVGEQKLANFNGQVSGSSVIGDIANVTYQNQIISEYLTSNYNGVTPEVIAHIVEINEHLNTNLKTADINSGVSWKLKTLEFSNLFSYGENNFVDFSSMSGLNGLFAPNTSGKSALMDCILFSLFDKSSRAFKPSDMINAKKDNFHTKINFEINGEDYFIEKTGRKTFSSQTKNFTAPVKTDFWKLGAKGEKISLNGEDRRYSNENIRELIGTAQTAMLTSFSLQDEHAGIILKSNSERKALLNSFVGIDIFGKLYEQANLKNKDIQTTLKVYNKNDYSTQLANANLDIGKYSNLHVEKSAELAKLKRRKGLIEKNLISWNSKLVKVDKIYDIKTLNKKQKETEDEIKRVGKEKIKIQKEIDIITAKSDKLKIKIKDYSENEIRDNYRNLLKFEASKKEYDDKIGDLNIHIAHKEQRLESFGEVDFDPDCKYCVENVNMFYKDIATIKEEYEVDLATKSEYEEKLKLLNRSIKEYSVYRKKLEQFEAITLLTNEFTADYKQNTQQITLYDHMEALEANKLETVKKEIAEYYADQHAIENNKKVQQKIDELQSNLDQVNTDIDDTSDLVQNYSSKLDVANFNKQRILDQMDEIRKLEIQNKAYDYYLKAVHRDGIPHELIKKVIPIFETEINNLLSPLVDFNIAVEIDDKYISFKIVYGDVEWPLELTSGMEKFIASIALRHALMKISNKPQPNFLFIDEGWGKLDSNNLSQLYILFNYLKGQYDLIWIVSHIEGMRDVIDQLLSISKLNGFSHVDNTN